MNVRDALLSNRIVGIVLLIMLAVFAGPNTLPRVLSSLFPNVVYEGVPCAWLKVANNRAFHQSLLGRSAPNPIQLRIQAGGVPTDPAGFLVMRIIVINESLGTVPIVYNPNQVIAGDNGTSGLGIIFTPANSLSTGATRPNSAPASDRDIRLLGPRQRCVHTIQIPAGNVLIDPSVTSGQATVRAYYRSTTQGPVVQPTGVVATPIFNDAGLWTGVVESESVPIPLPSQ